MFNLTAEQKDSFKWRFWNSFKSFMIPILAIALGVLLVELQRTPNELGSLLTWGLWENVLYASIIAVLGSLVASIDKARRMG